MADSLDIKFNTDNYYNYFRVNYFNIAKRKINSATI